MQRLQFALPSHRAFMCVVRLHMTQKTGLEPDPHPVTVSGTYCSVLSTGPPLGHRYRFPGGRGRANNCVAEFLDSVPTGIYATHVQTNYFIFGSRVGTLDPDS